MYEMHGWIVIRQSPGEDDACRVDEIAVSLQEMISNLGSENPSLRMVVLNGNYQVDVHAFTNRITPDVQEVFHIFEAASQAAPGSYGLLYVRDHDAVNGPSDGFDVWVLKRGKLVRLQDHLLSPCVPEIEDPA